MDVGPELAIAELCPVCTDRETLRREAPELAARLDEADAEDETPPAKLPKGGPQ